MMALLNAILLFDIKRYLFYLLLPRIYGFSPYS